MLMIKYCPNQSRTRAHSALKDTHPAEALHYSIDLPLGLIGFPALRKLKVSSHPEEAPFLHLQDSEKGEIEFIALEPYGIFKDYKVEILDPDLEYLDIQSPEDVHILNIVSIPNEAEARDITVNLVGPIIINRRTNLGKQIVIGNYKDYSSTHILFDYKN